MRIAKNFLQTDVVVIGIILIGFAIEMLMRALEVWLIPWEGKGLIFPRRGREFLRSLFHFLIFEHHLTECQAGVFAFEHVAAAHVGVAAASDQ